MVGGASSREAPTVEAESRARAERTSNIPRISVTLDVSKLSGWLNANAFCGEKGESIGGGRHAGKQGGGWGGLVGGASSREVRTVGAGHARSAR